MNLVIIMMNISCLKLTGSVIIICKYNSKLICLLIDVYYFDISQRHHDLKDMSKTQMFYCVDSSIYYSHFQYSLNQ